MRRVMLSRRVRPTAVAQLPRALTSLAHFSLTSFGAGRYPDRHEMNTESNEYSKTGSDAEAAQQDHAFDPEKSPEEHRQQSQDPGVDGKGNPLDVSPGNPEVSKMRDPQEGGPEASSSSSGTKSDRARTSGGSGGAQSRKGNKAPAGSGTS